MDGDGRLGHGGEGRGRGAMRDMSGIDASCV